MNILHLTTHLNLGGIASYLAVLGPALAARGHQVHVLSSGGAKSAELERNGLRCHTFPIRTKSELDPRLWFSLPRAAVLIKKENIGVLHAHTRVTQVMAAMLSRITGVPYVSTAHGFYKARLGRRLFPFWGERVVAVSALVAEELEKTHHVAASKIAVVANALDVEGLQSRLAARDRAKVRVEYGVPKDAFLVGCISRLVRDKGQEYLVCAMESLPGAYVIIVGDGRERPALEKLVSALGLNSRVRLIEGVPDTSGLLKAMDAFAHPATWREGFGLSMAEAMLAGVPVVATRIPAIHTLFKDGQEALLVAPKDPLALAAALRRLQDDPALARRLSEAGRALALRECRPERQADEIERIYMEVIARREAPKQSKA